MKALFLAVILACVSLGAHAQTLDEQIETLRGLSAQALEICKQLSPGTEGCHIFFETVEADPVVCPDPLEGSRLAVEQAVVNVTETQEAIVSMGTWFNNLSTVQLEQAKQALEQTLTDNPLGQ